MTEADPGGPLIRFLLMTVPQLTLGLLLSLVFALFYAFASALEAAAPKLRGDFLSTNSEEGEGGSAQLRQWAKDPRRFLLVIRSFKLFSLLLFSSCVIVMGLNSGTLKLQGETFPLLNLLLLLLLLFITFLLLAFCAMIPAHLARKRGLSFLQSSVWPLRLIFFFFEPLTRAAMTVSDAILRRKGLDPSEEDVLISEGELRELIERTEKCGLHEDEHSLLENVFSFGDKSAGDCMTHRVDLVAVEKNTSLPELLKLLEEEKFSRIPVYEEDIDHIIGHFHSRDLLLRVASGRTGEDFKLEDILRTIQITPETAKISAVFRHMQTTHSHMVVVIDEYGGTAGIVTMEDLLEELVGQIQDEYDEEEPDVQKISPNCWLLEGDTSPEELAEATGVELPAEEYDTIAGFILDRLDRIPDPDEAAQVRYHNALFTVAAMDDRRIEKVKLCLLSEEELRKIEEAETVEAPGDLI